MGNNFNHYHNYHVVGFCSYPLWVGLSGFGVITSFVVFFYNGFYEGILVCFLSLLLNVYAWCKDMVMEGLAGFNTQVVVSCLKSSFWFFMVTEFMFFVAIFWAYFDTAFNPSVWLGVKWPPYGFVYLMVDPMGLPFWNTLILVISGIFISHAKKVFMMNLSCRKTLGLTVVLGLVFIGGQAVEYYYANFSISDGAFASIFYFSTGVHFMHVVVGEVWMLSCLWRIDRYQFGYENKYCLSFVYVVYYWHFVDLVWIAVYIMVYVFPYR